MALDLTQLSPLQLDKFIHIQSIVARQEIEAAKVRTLRAYYDGDMPVMLSQRQMQFIGKLLTEGEFEFSHNVVKSIVDTLRERLNVSGFSVNGAGVDSDGEATPATQLAALFWSWWQANRLDAQQIRLHRRTIRDGLSYVMVDYDEAAQRPRFTLHAVDDGAAGVVMHHDPESPDRNLFANKYFTTFNPLEGGKTGDERKTTYLPHEIRKYIRGRGQSEWQQFSDPGDPSWPLSWRDRNGEPLGIPIIEFENPGGSEVAQIMGLQNALNKSWLDLIAAADMAGFPILVIENELNAAFPTDANVTDDNDIEGDDEFNVSPGRAISVDGARVHRLEASDMSQLINVIWTIVATIAGISRTPQYYLRPQGGSDVPSGEALKQLDSGLVKRAEERQLIFGQSWGDVMALAYKVQQTFGPGGLPALDKLKVSTVWDSPATRSEKTEAETGEILKRLGVPDAEIWSRLGFSPQDIARFKATMRSDQASMVATVAASLGKQATALPGATGVGGTATEDASPENLASTKGLNGIQVKAAVDLLAQVTSGDIAPSIALELIVSLGVDRAKAQAMVADAAKFEPANAPLTPVTNGNGVAQP